MADTINLDELRRLSAETGFSSKLLEKDYHLTRILQRISEKKIRDLVFKGGTCLNKCYLGFYRLSEDLDFVYNQDVKGKTKLQIKKILDGLRRELFEILNEMKFKTIKLEISFRKKLRNPTKMKAIKHEFIDALGEPILRKDVEIEVIDLTENFAEKFRALVIRKNVAIRDIYDIYFILKNKIAKVDKSLIDLILVKINENSEKKFTRKDFIDFINSLKSKLSDLNEKEISSLLKSGEKVNVKEMVQTIVREFENE